MTSFQFRLLGAAALATLFAPAALGQETTHRVELDQVQLNDVWSDMKVEVPDYSENVVSNSTAVGNAAAGLVKTGDIDTDVAQSLEGNVRAHNSVRGWSAGTAVSTTTAYGNATTGGTESGINYYRADQVATGDVSAKSKFELGGAYHAAGTTTAIANVSVPSNEYGENRTFQTQDSQGSVHAETDADMYVNGTSATFATTAGANAVSSTGYTSTNYTGAVQTTKAGESVRASTDVYMQDGHNVTSATTAFGNSVTAHNEWGYATMGREGSELYQQNDSSVAGGSYVTLDHWSGYATSSAYGVGNSGLVSNIGSDTAMYATQTNNGTVATQATLTGQSWVGGTGVVNSTSIGNALTADLCQYCGDAALKGQTRQVNNGAVYAQGHVNTPVAGGIYSSATAVGNSATYQSTGK